MKAFLLWWTADHIQAVKKIVVLVAGLLGYLLPPGLWQQIAIVVATGGLTDSTFGSIWKLLQDNAANGKELAQKLGSGGAIKALLVVLGLGLAAAPAPARAADFDWAVGPSIPLLQYDLGQKAAPVQLAPGWGVQVSGTSKALQVQWLGRRWDLVSLNVLFFGSLVTSSGVPEGQLSAALGPCIMSSLICLAYGHQVLAENSALVGGPGFLLLAFNFNFSVEPGPPPAPAFDRPTLAALPRGNTLYFGGP